MPATSTRISVGARFLLNELQRMAGDKGVCYPSQELLADRLSVSARQVRRYLVILTDAGLIEYRRRGWGRVAECRAERTSMSGQQIGAERTTVSGQERTSMSGPERTTVSGLLQIGLEVLAAAAKEPTEKTGEERLVELGINKSVARKAAREPGLVDCAIAEWERAGEKKDVGPGLLATILKKPLEFGFQRSQEGRWEPSEGLRRHMGRKEAQFGIEAARADRREKEQLESRSRQAEDYHAKQGQDEYRRRVAAWEKLPEATRQRIVEGVAPSGTFNAFLLASIPGPMAVRAAGCWEVLRQCFDVMEREAGK